MSVQVSEELVSAGIDAIFDEAKKKFGEVFVHAVSAIFDVLQLNETVALLAARTEGAGIGAHEISMAAATTMGAVVAHVLEMLPADQRKAAHDAAKSLMHVRSQVFIAASMKATQEH
ncbi:hypothetical protein [Piscinibacter gummiphilus]|uniref:Uncharacterized protein n=1 Tax=Piscinibacter gummiphilus TaxID=946333 RepID=A0ABZ0CNK4_9BURK|nr:hypothetical protein [Piscinibacter gummiphilus]WOB06557.1 hypothetical protein RXV79_16685 [Piscinibacter gummiphilus]